MMKSGKDWLLLTVLLIVWGLNYPVVKFGLEYTTPLAFSFFRAFLGAIVFLPLVLQSRKQQQISASVVFLAFWFIGETMVPAGITSVIIYTYPLFTVLFTRLFLADRFGALKAVGILAGFAGTLLVVTSGNFSHITINPYGFALLFVASISFAFSFVIYRKWLIGFDRVTLNIVQLLLAATILFVWTLSTNAESLITIPLGNYRFLLILLYTAVLGTSIAYLFWMTLVDKRGPVWLSAWLFLVPVVALIGSIVLLGEKIDVVQLVGFVIVIFGIAAVNRR
jgi:O-acetylserine/cysteine efflux transporter